MKQMLIDDFMSLYDTMAQSADRANMEIFGTAAKKMFRLTVNEHPDVAGEWLEMLRPISYNNYLSRAEADEIVSGLINIDGSPAPKWPYAKWEEMMNAAGLQLEEKPYYNKCALWVTMNMLFSDFAEAIAETMRHLPDRELPGLYHRLALAKLKDPDRKHFIRHYFNL